MHQLSVDLDESIISSLLQQQSQQQTSGNSLLSGSPPQSGRTSPPVTPSSIHVLQQQQSYQQLPLPQQQPTAQHSFQSQPGQLTFASKQNIIESFNLKLNKYLFFRRF